MLRKRPNTSMTLLACTVVKTRWPSGPTGWRLRGFGVPDFTDHDLVRVVAENRPEAPRKCQPLFLIDRNLCNTTQLILDRVFDRDDLVFDPS